MLQVWWEREQALIQMAKDWERNGEFQEERRLGLAWAVAAAEPSQLLAQIVSLLVAKPHQVHLMHHAARAQHTGSQNTCPVKAHLQWEEKLTFRTVGRHFS